MAQEREFRGRIGRDWRESEPWWPPETTPPAGRAQRGARRPRRRGVRPARLLRLPHRHPGDRRAGGLGRAPGQLPHHRAVLALPGLPADRAEPPPQRHGPGGRPGRGLPRLLGQAAPRERLPLGDPAPGGLRHLRRRQVAPEPRERDRHGLLAGHVAAGPRVRPLVRLPRRGDPPVRARPVPRQPLGAPAPPHRGGLSPERRPGRPRHRVRGRPAGRRCRTPLLPLPVHRGLPLSASCPAGVDRPLQGSLRLGVGRVARPGLRPPAGAGRPPRRHPPLAPTTVGPGLGRHQ